MTCSDNTLFCPEECSLCYHVLDDDGGVYVCLHCDKPAGFCPTHAKQHAVGEHQYFLNNTSTDQICVKFESGEFKGVDEESLPPECAVALKNLETFREYPPYVWEPAAESWPPRWGMYAGLDREIPGVRGFFNLGNTCYYNSTLHMLFGISPFVKYCLTDECRLANKLGFEFHRFVKEMMEGTHQRLINGRLRLALDEEAKQYLDPDPQDSQDYVRYAIDYIRTQLPEAPLSLIEFERHTTVKCDKCGAVEDVSRDKNARFLEIAPAIADRSKTPCEDIKDMIKRASEFKKSDWVCPKCGATGGTCYVKIVKAPKYLIVHNSLDIDGEDGERFKQPMRLTIDVDELMIPMERGRGLYKLKAFMDHRGAWAVDGHDIAFMRKRDKWICFNDELVTQIPCNSLTSVVQIGTQYFYLFKRKF